VNFPYRGGSNGECPQTVIQSVTAQQTTAKGICDVTYEQKKGERHENGIAAGEKSENPIGGRNTLPRKHHFEEGSNMFVFGDQKGGRVEKRTYILGGGSEKPDLQKILQKE